MKDDWQTVLESLRALEAGGFVPGSLRAWGKGEKAQAARALDSLARVLSRRNHQLSLLKKIVSVGFALSAEKDFNRLLETVVVEAQAVTNADAGSLYLLEEDVLKFVIVRNESLNLKMGGTSGGEISFQPVPLYRADGSENHANVAPHVVHTRKTIRIEDAYEAEGFDFSGTKRFDAQTGYRSKSFLAMPLINAEEKVVGVLQLINAQDRESGKVVPFEEDEALDSLVLLAAAALDGYIREEALRREIAQLKIEIDQARRERQVAEVTDTAFFKNLQERATQLRARKRKDARK